ncbi:hypothetical protein [Pseudoalteromonas atlantica]|uniref:hypothetical protein n=1 Tax=Pseudoalteromonas atlantica TaxID=288 RepID=UPI003735D309
MRVSPCETPSGLLKAIYTALVILTIEPLLLAINALPKPLLIATENSHLEVAWVYR